jgi:hypothetical protein
MAQADSHNSARPLIGNLVEAFNRLTATFA